MVTKPVRSKNVTIESRVVAVKITDTDSNTLFACMTMPYLVALTYKLMWEHAHPDQGMVISIEG